MVSKKFSLIAAACENYGIGINGKLPWSLKEELKYFNTMTSRVQDSNKMNALIMGRKTYFGIPPSKRPLPGRLNIVLSKNSTSTDYPSDVILCSSLSDAMDQLHTDQYKEKIENIWIVGGSAVYKEAMESTKCHRVYFTEIKKKFECDTFFPNIPNEFHLIDNSADPNVPKNVQEENGIQYEYKIYEKN